MFKNRFLSALFAVSALVNVAALVAGVYFVGSRGGIKWLTVRLSGRTPMQSFYDARLEQFRLLPNRKDDIYFVGDSITHHAEWAELFGPNAKNRGISNDTTAGILARLDEIIDGKPSKVFFMCGINDIQGGVPIETVKKNLAEILAKTSAALPNSAIYFQSILPIRPEIHYRKVNMEIISAVNGFISEQCLRYGNTHYIDLLALSDAAGLLKKDLTSDGIHLNGHGIMEWSKTILTLTNPGSPEAMLQPK